MSRKWTVRKLLNNVFDMNSSINLDTPITFSICEGHLEDSDMAEETLRPLGIFATEQGENSNEICFGFRRYK